MITIQHPFTEPEVVLSTVFWGFFILCSAVILCAITYKEHSFLRRKSRLVHVLVAITATFLLMYAIPITSVAQLAFVTGTASTGLAIIFFTLITLIFAGVLGTILLNFQLLPGAHVPKAYQLEKARLDFFTIIKRENSLFRTRARHVLNSQLNLFKKDKQLPDVVEAFYILETEKLNEVEFCSSAIESIHALGTLLAPLPRRSEGAEYFKSAKGKALVNLSKKRIGQLKNHLRKKFDEETLVESILEQAVEKAKSRSHPRVYKVKIAQARKAYSNYKGAVKEIVSTAQKAFSGKKKLEDRVANAEESIKTQLHDFELLCEHLTDSIHALGYDAYKPDPVFRGEIQKSLNRKK